MDSSTLPARSQVEWNSTKETLISMCYQRIVAFLVVTLALFVSGQSALAQKNIEDQHAFRHLMKLMTTDRGSEVVNADLRRHIFEELGIGQNSRLAFLAEARKYVKTLAHIEAAELQVAHTGYRSPLKEQQLAALRESRARAGTDAFAGLVAKLGAEDAAKLRSYLVGRRLPDRIAPSPLQRMSRP